MIAKNQVDVSRRTKSAIDVTADEIIYKACLEQAKLDYIATGTDAEIQVYIDAMERIRQKNRKVVGYKTMPQITNRVNIKKLVDSIKGSNANLQYSEEYHQHCIDESSVKRKNK